MVRRKPLDAITKAARPVDTQGPDEKVHGKRYTVNNDSQGEQPQRWDQRTKRHTFHVDLETLKRFKAHSKRQKESLAKLHNRAMRELLDREEPTT